MDERELIEAAREVQSAAHVPYSEYRVGAALETAAGEVFVGCNLENANFSNSLHAEEVAIAEAVKNGHREFTRLAVSSDRRDGVTPCGMCRQTLAEFCDEELPVVCDHGVEEPARYTLGELIPNTISRDTLE
ncbi:cytidine deaminase [Natrarchaeobius oligotrophus]|uniref:cytidine deaminase n=1 Tax=Natrarchaeobius chitinivorans TaxID=1679083 RepID=A0A3N6MTM1_NATCH|nr:cytidine deaminase [Natrarchaeobius chitinivorans]